MRDHVCFNLRRAEQTLTIGTIYQLWVFGRLDTDWNKLNLVSMHVPVVRQHCAQIEGFAFSHIITLTQCTINIACVLIFWSYNQRSINSVECLFSAWQGVQYHLLRTWRQLWRAAPFIFFLFLLIHLDTDVVAARIGLVLDQLEITGYHL